MLQGIQNNLLPHAAMISGCPSSFSRWVQDTAQKGKPSMPLQHLSNSIAILHCRRGQHGLLSNTFWIRFQIVFLRCKLTPKYLLWEQTMERSQNSGVDPICVHSLWLWLTLIVSGELPFIHTALLWRHHDEEPQNSPGCDVTTAFVTILSWERTQWRTIHDWLAGSLRLSLGPISTSLQHHSKCWGCAGFPMELQSSASLRAALWAEVHVI